MVYSKGQQTKGFIVQKASILFNRQGYMASSISDVMQATGLRKGGIYNHFDNKEDIMLSALTFSIDRLHQYFSEALAGKQGFAERLLAIASVLEKVAANELLPGGCPMMNAAIEADDANPLLREKVCSAMTELHKSVQEIIQNGILRGEVKRTVDTEYAATVFISTLEGAVMLSKLYGDVKYMRNAVLHIRHFLAVELSADLGLPPL